MCTVGRYLHDSAPLQTQEVTDDGVELIFYQSIPRNVSRLQSGFSQVSSSRLRDIHTSVMNVMEGVDRRAYVAAPAWLSQQIA